MVDLLIWLLIFALIVFIVNWVIDIIPLPVPGAKLIVKAILGVLALIVVIQKVLPVLGVH